MTIFFFSLTLLPSASGECLDSESNALSLRGGPFPGEGGGEEEKISNPNPF